jgi:hypothetical protein
MRVNIDGKTHELLDADELTNVEVMAIEEKTGQPISAWKSGSMAVITGIVWATLKRENPVLKYEHVNFRISDLEVEDEEADEAEAEDKGKESEAVS